MGVSSVAAYGAVFVAGGMLSAAAAGYVLTHAAFALADRMAR